MIINCVNRILRLLYNSFTFVTILTNHFMYRQINDSNRDNNRRITIEVELIRNMMHARCLFINCLFNRNVRAFRLLNYVKFTKCKVRVRITIRPRTRNLFFSIRSRDPIFNDPFIRRFIGVFRRNQVTLTRATLRMKQDRVNSRCNVYSTFNGSALTCISNNVRMRIKRIAGRCVQPINLQLYRVLSKHMFRITINTRIGRYVYLRSFLRVRVEDRMTIKQHCQRSVRRFRLVVSRYQTKLKRR